MPLVEVNTGEELSCSQEVPDESGFEGDAATTQVKDDQPIASNIATSTLLSSSLQEDAVHSLSAVELPQQLSMEETHTNVACDDGTESPSAKVELPQSNDDKNHPAPPSLAAADNQAPPMFVNDQGISIPAPPSPPPIHPPPPCPSPTAGKQPSADPPGADPTAEVLMSPQVSFYFICKVSYVTIKYCNRFVWQLTLSCFLCGQTAVCSISICYNRQGIWEYEHLSIMKYEVWLVQIDMLLPSIRAVYCVISQEFCPCTFTSVGT